MTESSINSPMDGSIADVEQAVKAAEDVGFNMGVDAGTEIILDRLRFLYIEDEDRPDRGTPEGEAILKLAQDMMVFIQQNKDGVKR